MKKVISKVLIILLLVPNAYADFSISEMVDAKVETSMNAPVPVPPVGVKSGLKIICKISQKLVKQLDRGSDEAVEKLIKRFLAAGETKTINSLDELLQKSDPENFIEKYIRFNIPKGTETLTKAELKELLREAVGYSMYKHVIETTGKTPKRFGFKQRGKRALRVLKAMGMQVQYPTFDGVESIVYLSRTNKESTRAIWMLKNNMVDSLSELETLVRKSLMRESKVNKRAKISKAFSSVKKPIKDTPKQTKKPTQVIERAYQPPPSGLRIGHTVGRGGSIISHVPHITKIDPKKIKIIIPEVKLEVKPKIKSKPKKPMFSFMDSHVRKLKEQAKRLGEIGKKWGSGFGKALEITPGRTGSTKPKNFGTDFLSRGLKAIKNKEAAKSIFETKNVVVINDHLTILMYIKKQHPNLHTFTTSGDAFHYIANNRGTVDYVLTDYKLKGSMIQGPGVAKMIKTMDPNVISFINIDIKGVNLDPILFNLGFSGSFNKANLLNGGFSNAFATKKVEKYLKYIKKLAKKENKVVDTGNEISIKMSKDVKVVPINKAKSKNDINKLGQAIIEVYKINHQHNGLFDKSGDNFFSYKMLDREFWELLERGEKLDDNIAKELQKFGYLTADNGHEVVEKISKNIEPIQTSKKIDIELLKKEFPVEEIFSNGSNGGNKIFDYQNTFKKYRKNLPITHQVIIDKAIKQMQSKNFYNNQKFYSKKTRTVGGSNNGHVIEYRIYGKVNLRIYFDIIDDNTLIIYSVGNKNSKAEQARNIASAIKKKTDVEKQLDKLKYSKNESNGWKDDVARASILPMPKTWMNFLTGGTKKPKKKKITIMDPMSIFSSTGLFGQMVIDGKYRSLKNVNGSNAISHNGIDVLNKPKINLKTLEKLTPEEFFAIPRYRNLEFLKEKNIEIMPKNGMVISYLDYVKHKYSFNPDPNYMYREIASAGGETEFVWRKTPKLNGSALIVQKFFRKQRGFGSAEEQKRALILFEKIFSKHSTELPNIYFPKVLNIEGKIMDMEFKNIEIFSALINRDSEIFKNPEFLLFHKNLFEQFKKILKDYNGEEGAILLQLKNLNIGIEKDTYKIYIVDPR